MSELTGRLDDMSTEVSLSVCVSACVCARFIFPLVTADTHKSPAHDGVAAAESQQFVFYSPSKRGFKISPLATN